jgi:hypothetical protein
MELPALHGTTPEMMPRGSCLSAAARPTARTRRRVARRRLLAAIGLDPLDLSVVSVRALC